MSKDIRAALMTAPRWVHGRTDVDVTAPRCVHGRTDVDSGRGGTSALAQAQEVMNARGDGREERRRGGRRQEVGRRASRAW